MESQKRLEELMITHRKRYNADYKAKVAIAALTESETLAELSTKYGIHSSQITRWKQELVENASDLFGKTKKKEENHSSQIDELHRQIGKLKVENDFLSNLPGVSSTGRRNKR